MAKEKSPSAGYYGVVKDFVAKLFATLLQLIGDDSPKPIRLAFGGLIFFVIVAGAASLVFFFFAEWRWLLAVFWTIIVLATAVLVGRLVQQAWKELGTGAAQPVASVPLLTDKHREMLRVMVQRELDLQKEGEERPIADVLLRDYSKASVTKMLKELAK